MYVLISSTPFKKKPIKILSRENSYLSSLPNIELACFGFLLSFYTNPWIAVDGYQNAYGTMAGIASAVLLLVIPMYFFGKKIRHVSWHWKILSFVHWDVDREVGE